MKNEKPGYCVSDQMDLFIKCHDLGFIYYLTLFVHGALDSRELSRYDFVYVVGRYIVLTLDRFMNRISS